MNRFFFLSTDVHSVATRHGAGATLPLGLFLLAQNDFWHLGGRTESGQKPRAWICPGREKVESPEPLRTSEDLAVGPGSRTIFVAAFWHSRIVPFQLDEAMFMRSYQSFRYLGISTGWLDENWQWWSEYAAWFNEQTLRPATSCPMAFTRFSQILRTHATYRHICQAPC